VTDRRSREAGELPSRADAIVPRIGRSPTLIASQSASRRLAMAKDKKDTKGKKGK